MKKGASSFVRMFYNVIRRKHMAGLWLAIVFYLVSNVSTVIYISSLKNDLQDLYQKDFLGQNYVQTARIKLLLLDKEVRNAFFSQEQGAKSLSLSKINEYKREIPVFIKKTKPVRKSNFASLRHETDEALSEYFNAIDMLLPKSILGIRDKTTAPVWEKMKIGLNQLDVLLDSMDNVKQRRDIHVYNAINLSLTGSILFTLITLAVSIGYRVFMYHKTKAPA